MLGWVASPTPLSLILSPVGRGDDVRVGGLAHAPLPNPLPRRGEGIIAPLSLGGEGMMLGRVASPHVEVIE